MPDTSGQFIYILGPTATGKTELSLRVSETLGFPIINADSIQVYTRTDIGTAKPTPEERNQCPHFLFDYVEPPTKQTAADYLRDVQVTLKDKGIARACFTGGSGFYIQALEKGLFPEAISGENVKDSVEKEIESLGYEKIYENLKQKDPLWAEGISPNDHYRVRRAAEVMRAQGKTMTELREMMATGQFSPLPPHNALKIGFTDEREKLLQRVEKRTAQMLERGLVDEVKNLRSLGLSEWLPMNSVGYKEVQSFLDGEIKEEDLADAIVTATMQLIKKQKTWFKRDSDIIWFRPEEADKALTQIVEWSKSH